MNIGLLVIATRKYNRFFNPLQSSIRKYFCPDQNVTVYLFTDEPVSVRDVVCLPIEHKPWPYITPERYHQFHRYREAFTREDFLFYLDVDMEIVAPVSTEILPTEQEKWVGTLHPGFFTPWSRGAYETRPASTAYVGKHEGTRYYAGGFNGGTRPAFLEMAATLACNIDKDREKGIIARWHDESHLNRFYVDKSIKVLSPAYCYPESWELPFSKKILALDKNHAEMRAL